jgi:hypothetical protein
LIYFLFLFFFYKRFATSSKSGKNIDAAAKALVGEILKTNANLHTEETRDPHAIRLGEAPEHPEHREPAGGGGGGGVCC